MPLMQIRAPFKVESLLGTQPTQTYAEGLITVQVCTSLYRWQSTLLYIIPLNPQVLFSLFYRVN